MTFLGVIQRAANPNAPPAKIGVVQYVNGRPGDLKFASKPAAPQSLLAEAAATATAEAVETVRAGIMAQVVGEPVDDVRAYALACRECGITPEIEATHVAAARSFDRWRDWPAEREAALERRNAAEAHWQQAETAADLALTQARKKRRAAQSEIARLLRDSDRPYRFATVNSPFLFASLAEAAKVAGQPSLTFEELSSLQENRYPDFAVAQARAQKLAEIKAAQ